MGLRIQFPAHALQGDTGITAVDLGKNDFEILSFRSESGNRVARAYISSG